VAKKTTAKRSEGAQSGGSPRQTERLIRELKSLPTLSFVATQALQLAADDTATFDKLALLIKSDPAISVKLLRIANSASRGLTKQVASVEQAIRLLGLQAVKSAILSIQVFDVMEGAGSSGDDRELWIHTVGVATMCRLLAERTRLIDPEVAFAIGLLHDMGKIALVAASGQSYVEAVSGAEEAEEPLLDAERRVFGLHHTEAGKILAEKWQLSENLSNCIWLHHQPLELVTEQSGCEELLRLLKAADCLCRRQGVGFSGNWIFVDEVPTLVEPLGLKEEDIKAATERFAQEFEQRATVLGMEVDNGQVFFRALQKANAKLGRLYETVDEMKHSLEIKAAEFDNLHKMNLELGSGLGIEETLEVIGRYAVATFDVQKVIIYVVQESKNILFGKLVAAEGAVENIYLTAAQLPKAAGKARGSEAFIAEMLSRLSEEEGLPKIDLKPPGDQLAGKIFSLPLDFKGDMLGGIIVDDRSKDKSAHRHTTPAEWLAFADAATVAAERVRLREQVSAHIQTLLDLQRRAREMEDEIIKSKKLAALGRVAAGAAHEMNNPLTIISGRAQMLLGKESSDSRKKMLNVIIEQCARLSRIISDLLNYARPMPPNHQKFDLVETVKNVVSLNRDTIEGKRVKVNTHLPKSAVMEGDPDQILQVITNVIMNAVQASEEGSEIDVTVNGDPKREEIKVVVQDYGEGIAAENIERIFEPFFSTKEAGRGTGLGLAISHSIVKAHGGRILVRSTVDKGSRFTILLPQVAPKSQ